MVIKLKNKNQSQKIKDKNQNQIQKIKNNNMETGAGRPRNAPPKVKVKTYTYALRNTQLLNTKILFLAVKSPPSKTLHVRLGGGGAAPKNNAHFSHIGFKKIFHTHPAIHSHKKLPSSSSSRTSTYRWAFVLFRNHVIWRFA
jgi:hypothetical protein